MCLTPMCSAVFPNRDNQQSQHAADSYQETAHDEFHVRLLSISKRDSYFYSRPKNGLRSLDTAYSNSRATTIMAHDCWSVGKNLFESCR